MGLSLATSYIYTEYCTKLLSTKGFCHLMFRKLEGTDRAGESGSDVELGAGTADTTGLVRRASLDVETLNTDRFDRFWLSYLHSATPPSHDRDSSQSAETDPLG